MNEKALIRKCLNGDRQAFDELIRLYYDYVYGFLRKMTADETLAEDLTQETFLKMINNIERFDPGGSASFGTWLITIAKNCCIDCMRHSRICVENIESLPLEDENDTAAEVERKMQYEQVISLMKTLPPEQAVAIRLKYVEDMTLAQIAERFGVPTKTVKSRIHDGTASPCGCTRTRRNAGSHLSTGVSSACLPTSSVSSFIRYTSAEWHSAPHAAPLTCTAQPAERSSAHGAKTAAARSAQKTASATTAETRSVNSQIKYRIKSAFGDREPIFYPTFFLPVRVRV